MRRACLLLAACGAHPHFPDPVPVKPPPVTAKDPDGAHKRAVADLFQPYVDNELIKGVVVGIYDNGVTEIYGFGTGPGGKVPDGSTLFELGAVTKVYTSLLLADAVQHHEVELDQAVSELMPAGVTIPTREHTAITLRMLANHSSGLPRLPPSVPLDAPDPYASYSEDQLLADLQHTDLQSAPGTVISVSTYGPAVLGYALGRKIGGGYAKALETRVLAPLELKDTYLTVPESEQARRTVGSNTDLQPASPWHWDVLAPGGGLISDARDQLALVKAELDAAGGGAGTLRPALRLTQEEQLDQTGENEGLGLQIDPGGRYWHSGSTAGFHSFVGFDPKHKRGVVILSSTSLTPIDRFGELIYDLLDGKKITLPEFPAPNDLALFAGTYDLAGTKLEVAPAGKRLYVTGPNEPRYRLVPLTPGQFWLEEIQGLLFFAPDGDKMRLTLILPSGQRILAVRQ